MIVTVCTSSVVTVCQGGVEKIPKMFDISKLPTGVVDARDSQLHQDYTINSDKTAVLSKSQLIAFGLKCYLFCILRKSRINLLDIATGAFFLKFRIIL
jgi:hypothetical protein